MIGTSPLAIVLPQRNVRDQPTPSTTITAHITGRATYLNAERRGEHPLIYLGNAFGKPGRSFAHYSVDPWGQVGCTAPESERAWAQGWGTYGGRDGLLKKLSRGELKVPAWWLSFWGPRGFGTPVDLVVGDSPNYRSISIEFIQYGNQFRLTLAQYRSGHALMMDIAFRNGIGKLELPTVRGHEDVDPWGRGTDAGGWDPGAHRVHGPARFSWEAMLNGPAEMPHEAIATPPRPKWAPELDENGDHI